MSSMLGEVMALPDDRDFFISMVSELMFSRSDLPVGLVRPLRSLWNCGVGQEKLGTVFYVFVSNGTVAGAILDRFSFFRLFCSQSAAASPPERPTGLERKLL